MIKSSISKLLPMIGWISSSTTVVTIPTQIYFAKVFFSHTIGKRKPNGRNNKMLPNNIKTTHDPPVNSPVIYRKIVGTKLNSPEKRGDISPPDYP